MKSINKHSVHASGGDAVNSNHFGRQMMTFSEFVRSLEPHVDEVQASKLFKEFKTNLMQSKVDKFFDEQKHTEWFRSRYHPQENLTLSRKRDLSFLKRLEIFNQLLGTKQFDKIQCTSDFNQTILNIVNSIIVKLENGPDDLVQTLLQNVEQPFEHSELLKPYVPSKPHSIVLENLHLNITQSEIEDVCRSVDPNFLRVCLIDPHYVKGGQLRSKAFVVYKHDVNIKNVCWKLSRSKINNRLLDVCVNALPQNRIRFIDPISNHKLSVINDIRNAIVFIINLDELRGLYGRRKCLLDNLKLDKNVVTKNELNDSNDNVPMDQDDLASSVAPPSPPRSDKSGDSFDISSLDDVREKLKKKCLELKLNLDLSSRKIFKKLSRSTNPLLLEALTYLTDYTYNTCLNYQLEKVPNDLLGEQILECNDNELLDNLLENLPFTHEENIKTLDKMILYLRIVHSFDYYNKTFYRYEDDLPCRLAFFHIRDSPNNLPNDIDIDVVRKYIKEFNQDLREKTFLQHRTFLSKEEERYAYRSYKKNIENELESYAERIIMNNEPVDAYKCKHCTRVFQKLKDMGRHFVSKHRCAVDTIEVETDFFNCYMFDTTKINPTPPKHLLENKPNRFVAEMRRINKIEEEDPNLLQAAVESLKKIDPSILKEAPRKIDEATDSRKDAVVDYNDISFDDEEL